MAMISEKEAAWDGKEPELLAQISSQTELSTQELEALISDVESDIQREQGVRAYIRSRPSSVRVVLAVALTLLMVAALLPTLHLEHVPLERLLVHLGSLGTFFGASVWYGVRPLSRPPMPRWFNSFLVVASLVSLVVLAFWPLTHPMPGKPGDWANATKCLVVGTALGLPTYVVLRLLDRGGSSASAFFAASAAALSANIGLAMLCDNTSIGHLLRGHASIGGLFIGAVVTWKVVIGRLLRAG